MPARGAGGRPSRDSSLSPGIVTARPSADHPDMTAAAPLQGESQRGAPRLLEHCAALGRLFDGDRGTARDRLELELGGELADRLCRALAFTHGRRSGHLWG
jgi:hypothetical protein